MTLGEATDERDRLRREMRDVLIQLHEVVEGLITAETRIKTLEMVKRLDAERPYAPDNQHG